MTAGKVGMERPKGRLKIATKYVNLTRQYYASLGEQVDVIKLYGSMELAPLVGLGDYIVDVVDTGNTLRANGLEPLEEICKVSSRLIVNKASFKRKQALLNPIWHSLNKQLKHVNKRKSLIFIVLKDRLQGRFFYIQNLIESLEKSSILPNAISNKTHAQESR